MRAKILSMFLVMVWACAEAHGEAVKGEEREWTSNNGKSVTGKLVEVEGDKIGVMIRGRFYKLDLKDLSEDDRLYVESMKPVPPSGRIAAYEARFENDTQREYYQNNGIKSFVWSGDTEKEMLPFVLYTTREKTGENRKYPIIIHLSGTGGVGTDNTKTVFKDAGGVAKTFFSESLQKKNPCHILIPQASYEGAWFSASYTDPSPTLSWVVMALRHLMNDASNRIDPERVYVTGLSMGGAGVYQAMAKFPEIFAAGIPISYVESHELFHKDNVGSLWVVLNEGDKGQSMEMFKQFKKKYSEMGGTIKSTVYDKDGHDAWGTMLGDQEFRVWLFQRVKRRGR